MSTRCFQTSRQKPWKSKRAFDYVSVYNVTFPVIFGHHSGHV